MEVILAAQADVERAAVGHGVKGVLKQVEGHLAHLRLVAAHPGVGGLEIAAACDLREASVTVPANPLRGRGRDLSQVRDLLARWVPVFDRRVDPVELRLRAAAVVISLATGPYRSQAPDWRTQTVAMVRSAEALVRQVVPDR